MQAAGVLARDGDEDLTSGLAIFNEALSRPGLLVIPSDGRSNAIVTSAGAADRDRGQDWSRLGRYRQKWRGSSEGSQSPPVEDTGWPAK
jgi:hypothetical protein